MRPASAGLLLLLSLPSAAWADERFDHRGAVGLLLGGGGSLQESTPLGVQGQRDSGFRGLTDLGGTYAIGFNGNELAGWIRGGFGGASWALTVIAGYRGYFGYDRLKTFLDLDLAVEVRPLLIVGPRVGGGFQWELSPNVGVFAGIAVQGGLGTGIFLSGELFGGVQLRSYLLEL